MDLNNLKNKSNILISHMINNNYSQRYISKIKKEIETILDKGTSYDSYFDYYENYLRKNSKQTKRKHRLDSLNVIMNFDQYNILPNRHKYKHKIIDNSNYAKLNDEFKKVIDKYIEISKIKNKKGTTIVNEARNAAVFLMYLQNIGITKIKDIKEDSILNFFVNDKYEIKYSHSYKKNIRIVFKTCIPYIKECERIVEYFPVMKENHKNIQFLNKNEISAIKTVLNNENSNISLRHKAIVSLLLYTGLRSCDIANLKLQDIDWDNEVIKIVQVKTNIELELPLLTIVGNVIYAYIINERPLTKSPYLFLRLDCNLPITRSTVRISVSKVMDEANIRMKKGERRGTHIFRYNLATTLLEKNIPQPVISQTLGHTSPESLESYLKADIVHLRQCGLSVEQFSSIGGERND